MIRVRILLLLCLATHAHGQSVFKCVEPDGSITYSNIACPDDTVSRETMRTMRGGYSPFDGGGDPYSVLEQARQIERREAARRAERQAPSSGGQPGALHAPGPVPKVPHLTKDQAFALAMERAGYRNFNALTESQKARVYSELAAIEAELIPVLTGRVTRIVDGDTLVVGAGQGSGLIVRLAGIDAPETDQPFGAQATAYLSDWVLNRTVVIEGTKRDRHDRLIAKLLLNGQDVNLALLSQGYAWWFREYAHEQSPEDRARYEAAEASARGARLGLWGGPGAVAPWDWRARR